MASPCAHKAGNFTALPCPQLLSLFDKNFFQSHTRSNIADPTVFTASGIGDNDVVLYDKNHQKPIFSFCWLYIAAAGLCLTTGPKGHAARFRGPGTGQPAAARPLQECCSESPFISDPRTAHWSGASPSKIPEPCIPKTQGKTALLSS